LTEDYRRLLCWAPLVPHVAGSLAPPVAHRVVAAAMEIGRRCTRQPLSRRLWHRRRGNRRSIIRRVAGSIGSDAESIAYLYGACDRDAFHPRIGTDASLQFVDRFTRSEYPIQDATLRDFCELTLANELELAQSSDAFSIKHRGELARLAAQMRRFVSANAHDACSGSFLFARRPMR
jgi:hypothetical protein